jgi:hypothetical protein
MHQAVANQFSAFVFFITHFPNFAAETTADGIY